MSLDRAFHDKGLDERWRWKPVYLRAFVDELHWSLLDGVGARWPATERLALVEAGLARASRLAAVDAKEHLSTSRVHMLASMIEAAHDNLGASVAEWRDQAPWNIAAVYCDRLGLTVTSSSGVVTSPAGSMMVRLRGIDRLRWLLAIETSLATSDRDSWCIDLGSVRHLAERTSWLLNADPVGPPISDSTFGRWTELGLLEYWQDEGHGAHGYDVTPIGREIFGELSEPRQWIDEGFERLHRFIDDSLRLVPTSADETTTFSVMDAIDEARRQCVPGPEQGI